MLTLEVILALCDRQPSASITIPLGTGKHVFSDNGTNVLKAALFAIVVFFVVAAFSERTLKISRNLVILLHFCTLLPSLPR